MKKKLLEIFMFLSVWLLTILWYSEISAENINSSYIKESINIIASNETPDARICGINVQPALKEIKDNLASKGIIRNQSADKILVISFLTKINMEVDYCSTTAMIGLYEKISYYDRLTEKLKDGKIVLWQRGMTAITEVKQHEDATMDMTEKLLENLLNSYFHEKNN